jgi:hypothetical protein
MNQIDLRDTYASVVRVLEDKNSALLTAIHCMGERVLDTGSYDPEMAPLICNDVAEVVGQLRTENSALEGRIEELEAAIHGALPALELGGRWHEYTGHLTIDEDTVSAVEEARGFLLAVMEGPKE